LRLIALYRVCAFSYARHMGLTIYYDLDVPGDQPASRVRGLVQALRDAALRVGMEKVSAVRTIIRADCDGLEREHVDLDWLVRCFAAREVEGARSPVGSVTVLPEIGYGFGAVIGRCEPVVLGLARHPASMIEGGVELSTGFSNWSWRACTKTQYAGTVSVGHFVESHRRVVALLDAAADLGFQVSARDDSGYWEHRDEQRLVKSLEYWNRLVAKFAGRLAEAWDQGSKRQG